MLLIPIITIIPHYQVILVFPEDGDSTHHDPAVVEVTLQVIAVQSYLQTRSVFLITKPLTQILLT